MSTVYDAIEYLYKNGKKDLAIAVIKEIKGTQIVPYTQPYTVPYDVGNPYWACNTLEAKK